MTARRRRRRHDVVRMFPDYAESVLWFDGPVPYPQTGLDEALVADLRAWDDAYYAGLDDFEWRSGTLRRKWRASGRALAERVAAALGSDFAVELEDRLVRVPHPAQVPAAAAAFAALAAARAGEQARIAGLLKGGAELGWYAYSPTSDPDLDPPAPRSPDGPDH